MSEATLTQRQCVIEDVFDLNFIELLKLAPANPLVRGLVLKFTGKMPPVECAAFESLKDWVELNGVKRIFPQKRRSREPGISIEVDFSETEYGRASYSVSRSGSADYEMSADELLEIIQDNLDNARGLEGALDDIGERIDEDAWARCDADLNDYGDYDYSDWESDNSGNGRTQYSRPDIENAVRRFLREQHPELAEQLEEQI